MPPLEIHVLQPSMTKWSPSRTARDEIAAITAPTLCVAAGDDPSTPPDQLELIAERIPGARLATIADGRHLVNVERADEVNGLLAEHLA